MLWTASDLESVHFFYVHKAKLGMGRRFLDAEAVNTLMQAGISVEGWLNIVYLYNSNHAGW